MKIRFTSFGLGLIAGGLIMHLLVHLFHF